MRRKLVLAITTITLSFNDNFAAKDFQEEINLFFKKCNLNFTYDDTELVEIKTNNPCLFGIENSKDNAAQNPLIFSILGNDSNKLFLNSLDKFQLEFSYNTPSQVNKKDNFFKIIVTPNTSELTTNPRKYFKNDSKTHNTILKIPYELKASINNKLLPKISKQNLPENLKNYLNHFFTAEYRHVLEDYMPYPSPIIVSEKFKYPYIYNESLKCKFSLQIPALQELKKTDNNAQYENILPLKLNHKEIEPAQRIDFFNEQIQNNILPHHIIYSKNWKHGESYIMKSIRFDSQSQYIYSFYCPKSKSIRHELLIPVIIESSSLSQQISESAHFTVFYKTGLSANTNQNFTISFNPQGLMNHAQYYNGKVYKLPTHDSLSTTSKFEYWSYIPSLVESEENAEVLKVQYSKNLTSMSIPISLKLKIINNFYKNNTRLDFNQFIKDEVHPTFINAQPQSEERKQIIEFLIDHKDQKLLELIYQHKQENNIPFKKFIKYYSLKVFSYFTRLNPFAKRKKLAEKITDAAITLPLITQELKKQLENYALGKNRNYIENIIVSHFNNM